MGRKPYTLLRPATPRNKKNVPSTSMDLTPATEQRRCSLGVSDGRAAAAAPFPQDCSLHLQPAPCFRQASHQNPEEVSYCLSARQGGIAIIGQEELGSWATTPARPFHQITARSPLPAGPAPRPFLPAAGRCACATQERRCKSRTYSPSSKSNLS
jgi:hypothetical protein